MEHIHLSKVHIAIATGEIHFKPTGGMSRLLTVTHSPKKTHVGMWQTKSQWSNLVNLLQNYTFWIIALKNGSYHKLHSFPRKLSPCLLKRALNFRGQLSKFPKFPNCLLVGGWTTHLKNMNVKMGSSSPNFGVKIPKMFELPPPRFRAFRAEDSGCQRCQQFFSSRVLFSEPRNIRKKNDLSTPLASVVSVSSESV